MTPKPIDCAVAVRRASLLLFVSVIDGSPESVIWETNDTTGADTNVGATVGAGVALAVGSDVGLYVGVIVGGDVTVGDGTSVT